MLERFFNKKLVGLNEREISLDEDMGVRGEENGSWFPYR